MLVTFKTVFSRPLFGRKKKNTEDQMTERLNFMLQFIANDTENKCQQIFNEIEIELNSLSVQCNEMLNKIDEVFKKKKLALEKQTKIINSVTEAKYRKRFNEYKFSHIQDIAEKAEHRLLKLDNWQYIDIYKRILHSLLIEGLCILMEPVVIIRVRFRDLNLATSILRSAIRRYVSLIGNRSLTVAIDTQEFLDDLTRGGLDLITPSGHIKVTNNLWSRLDRILQDYLSLFSTELFGINPNRTFSN